MTARKPGPLQCLSHQLLSDTKAQIDMPFYTFATYLYCLQHEQLCYGKGFKHSEYV
jgi:hypothetical protein